MKQTTVILTYLVGAVGGHGGSKDDRPLDAKLDECPGGTPGSVECPKQLIHSSELARTSAKEG